MDAINITPARLAALVSLECASVALDRLLSDLARGNDNAAMVSELLRTLELRQTDCREPVALTPTNLI